jgi:lysophospholipase L1-like esterase
MMFLIGLLMVAFVQSADIVVFGDSWGTQGGASFKKMASSHGLTVSNHAVSGSTAAQWAKPGKVNDLTNWVEQNKDAKYVWITIGGNDAADGMEAGQPISKILGDFQKNERKFIEPLFKAVPNIKVVQFGYDILFWDYFECTATATAIFGKHCGKHGSANFTVCANHLMFQVQDAIVSLAANYTQLTAPNLMGSLQKAGGISAADIGKPNDKFFSPNKYTGPTKFCLHANDEGYDIIFKNLWDLYFSKHEAERLAQL